MGSNVPLGGMTAQYLPAHRQKKEEHGKSNLHAEEDLLQKVESLNLDP